MLLPKKKKGYFQAGKKSIIQKASDNWCTQWAGEL